MWHPNFWRQRDSKCPCDTLALGSLTFNTNVKPCGSEACFWMNNWSKIALGRVIGGSWAALGALWKLRWHRDTSRTYSIASRIPPGLGLASGVLAVWCLLGLACLVGLVCLARLVCLAGLILLAGLVVRLFFLKFVVLFHNLFDQCLGFVFLFDEIEVSPIRNHHFQGLEAAQIDQNSIWKRYRT